MIDSQKIIFCTNLPFNNRDYKRFGFDLLISEGFSVYVLEFTPIFNKDVYNSYSPANPIGYNDHYLLKKKSDFYKIIEKIKKNSIFIMLFSRTNKTKFIYKYLNENKIVFGNLILGFIPEPKRPFLEKVNLAFKFPELVINKFKFFNYENHSINPNFYLVGGSICNNMINQKNAKIIKAHSFDYDNYLKQESKKSKRIIKDEYIVFLDEYVPFHSDYIYEKMNPYLLELNNR